jgi:hypothetical protein
MSGTAARAIGGQGAREARLDRARGAAASRTASSLSRPAPGPPAIELAIRARTA